MFSEPPRPNVDRVQPGAMYKPSPPTRVPTSTVGTIPPSHVPGRRKSPDVTAIKVTFVNVWMTPPGKIPQVNGPERLEPNEKLEPTLDEAGSAEYVNRRVLEPTKDPPGCIVNKLPWLR